jgi:4-hydroxy-2-oxoheptanedioate aldolase
MRENRIRNLWREDKAVVNGWLAIPSTFSAETMAHQGWDSLTIDMQHGVVDYQMAVNMLTAVSTTNTVPMVGCSGRSRHHHEVAGCRRLCRDLPDDHSRAEAEKLVSYMRYAPRGVRSFGPIRALLYGGADYPTKANDTVIPFAMIETKQALDNLDDILSVEGLDAIYVGPADLSLTLGCTPKFDQEEKPVVEAIDYIIAKAKQHGVFAGIHNGTPEYAQRMIAKGFRFVTIASDARLMAAGAQQTLTKMRAGPGVAASGSY